MKKTFNYFTILMLLLSTTALAQFTTLWERNERNGNYPTWASAGSERGFAAGVVDGNKRVYIPSRTNGADIIVLDGETGDDVTLTTPFDLTNVTGGTFPIQDMDVSDDGVIFLSNLTTNASTSPFKLYVWETEGGDFDYSFEFTTTEAYRFDKFETMGDWNGTFTVYGAASSTDPGVVVKWTTTDKGTNWDEEIITLSGAYTVISANADIAVFEDGSFYLQGNGGTPLKYDATGAYVANSLMSGTTSSRNGGMIYSTPNTDYLLSYTFRPNDDADNSEGKIGRLVVYDVADPANPVVFGTSELQGSADGYSAIHGDVGVIDNEDGTFTFYVIDGVHGLGAYNTSDLNVPVEMTTFTASTGKNAVTLSWETATEVNNNGFEVERSVNKKEWKMLAFVEGNGTTADPRKYSFTDNTVKMGSYFYRLKQVDTDGSYEYSAVIEVSLDVPSDFGLSQNYPNPFNPTTKIEFTLPEASNVTLNVYNLLGEKVATLADGFKPGGVHNVTFNAEQLNSGLYVYKLEAGSFVQMRKMMLMK